jgi:hypothetical protein
LTQQGVAVVVAVEVAVSAVVVVAAPVVVVSAGVDVVCSAEVVVAATVVVVSAGVEWVVAPWVVTALLGVGDGGVTVVSGANGGTEGGRPLTCSAAAVPKLIRSCSNSFPTAARSNTRLPSLTSDVV